MGQVGPEMTGRNFIERWLAHAIEGGVRAGDWASGERHWSRRGESKRRGTTCVRDCDRSSD